MRDENRKGARHTPRPVFLKGRCKTMSEENKEEQHISDIVLSFFVPFLAAILYFVLPEPNSTIHDVSKLTIRNAIFRFICFGFVSGFAVEWMRKHQQKHMSTKTDAEKYSFYSSQIGLLDSSGKVFTALGFSALWGGDLKNPTVWFCLLSTLHIVLIGLVYRRHLSEKMTDYEQQKENEPKTIIVTIKNDDELENVPNREATQKDAIASDEQLQITGKSTLDEITKTPGRPVEQLEAPIERKE